MQTEGLVTRPRSRASGQGAGKAVKSAMLTYFCCCGCGVELVSNAYLFHLGLVNSCGSFVAGWVSRRRWQGVLPGQESNLRSYLVDASADNPAAGGI